MYYWNEENDCHVKYRWTHGQWFAPAGIFTEKWFIRNQVRSKTCAHKLPSNTIEKPTINLTFLMFSPKYEKNAINNRKQMSKCEIKQTKFPVIKTDLLIRKSKKHRNAALMLDAGIALRIFCDRISKYYVTFFFILPMAFGLASYSVARLCSACYRCALCVGSFLRR